MKDMHFSPYPSCSFSYVTPMKPFFFYVQILRQETLRGKMGQLAVTFLLFHSDNTQIPLYLHFVVSPKDALEHQCCMKPSFISSMMPATNELFLHYEDSIQELEKLCSNKQALGCSVARCSSFEYFKTTYLYLGEIR